MDSRIILRLMLKYKRVHKANLSKTLDEDNKTIQNKLDFLIRTGLVLTENNFYYLNKYSKFQVWNFLHHKGMI